MPSEAALAPRRLTIRKVSPDRPWVWLNAGWQDLMANPRIGFFYGGALAAAGWLLIMILLGVRSGWVILPASAGFFMVAPLLATGLYEASKLRAEGKPVTFSACLAGFTRNGQQLAFLGVVLVILHLFWVRVAGHPGGGGFRDFSDFHSHAGGSRYLNHGSDCAFHSRGAHQSGCHDLLGRADCGVHRLRDGAVFPRSCACGAADRACHLACL